MVDLNSKRQQFEEQLNEIAGKRERLGDSGLEPEMQGVLQAWESRLDAELMGFRQRLDSIRLKLEPEVKPKVVDAESPQAYAPVTRRRFSRADATLISWFQDVDSMMLEELELGRYPLPEGFQEEVEIVYSDDEIKTAIAGACDLDDVPPGINWKDYHLGVFHIPGRGTVLNQAHYANKYGSEHLNDRNPQVLAEVVSDLAMERWGWGFLLEYTTLGIIAGDAGLWPAMLAHRARLPYADPDAHELAEAIYMKWQLLKTGWQDWVWQYVMFKAHRPVGSLVDRPRPGRMFELVMKIQNLFPLRIYPFGVKVSVRRLADLVKYIFLEQAEIAPNVSQWAIAQFQSLCVEHDEKIRELVKLPLSRILGRLYFSWLENQVGILSTPYATLIAAHLPRVDLGATSAENFMAFADQDPRNNPDARLAMLSQLDSRVKYNPQAMFTAAWERLKLEGPRVYFKR